RASHRPLSSAEVQALAKGGQFEIGCHTVTHPKLSSLPESLQHREIQASRTSIDELIGRRVTSFAYPYGSASDFTTTTSDIVRQCGFSSACATTPGAVDGTSQLFRLPRLQVEDWDGDEFGQRLEGWFDRFA